MRLPFNNALAVAAVAALVGCATVSPTQNVGLDVPSQLSGKVVVLGPSDPDYPRGQLDKAVNGPGKGGIYSGMVIKTKEDLPVYRLWSGPQKVDDYGNTSRFGSWWSYVPPSGTAADYRRNYEVCYSWNDLSWVAVCTLKAGSVVAIGPGQSVSEEMCGKKGESYAENPDVWQMYIDCPSCRRAELSCPKYRESDYEADQGDLSRRK